jgi:hypothetical protein
VASRPATTTTTSFCCAFGKTFVLADKRAKDDSEIVVWRVVYSIE